MPQVVCIGAGGDRLAALRDTGSRIHPPPERRPGGDRGQLAAITAIRHDGVGGMVPPPTPRDAPREPNGRAAASKAARSGFDSRLGHHFPGQGSFAIAAASEVPRQEHAGLVAHRLH